MAAINQSAGITNVSGQVGQFKEPEPPHVVAERDLDSFTAMVTAELERAQEQAELLAKERAGATEQFELRARAIGRTIEMCERALQQPEPKAFGTAG